MKKVFTLLMAMTMVIGLAGIASADCLNCPGLAGNIDRGCESSQRSCDPFDFEWPYDYCSKDKSTPNRAVFKICDCITDGDFQTVVAGDTIDISMEILVNGKTGDNGVYWAEDVSSTGIKLMLFEDQDLACAKTFNDNSRMYDYDNLDSDENPVPTNYFEGPYKFLKANGTTGSVYTGSGCAVADGNRVVKIVRDGNKGQGYVVQPGDEIDGLASWVIDIPEMRVDPSLVSAGDQVWVRICLILDCAGICSNDTTCCCDVYIGELCCPFDSSSGAGLIYPYFPPANTAVWNLLGMTITNLSSINGTAVITMYESDGDVGELEVDILGNRIYLETIPNVAAAMTKIKGAGTLGDAKSYLTVDAEFPATGFAMIADTIDGASMGYLPLQAWEVDVVGLLGDLMD